MTGLACFRRYTSASSIKMSITPKIMPTIASVGQIICVASPSEPAVGPVKIGAAATDIERALNMMTALLPSILVSSMLMFGWPLPSTATWVARPSTR